MLLPFTTSMARKRSSYTTEQQDLLFQIIDIYVIPKELVEVIKRMYTNSEIEITVRKEKKNNQLHQEVQQGNNIALILFLFIMLDVSQALKDKWNFTPPPCCGFLNEKKWGKS
jgi:hypothetical protein